MPDEPGYPVLFERSDRNIALVVVGGSAMGWLFVVALSAFITVSFDVREGSQADGFLDNAVRLSPFFLAVALVVLFLRTPRVSLVVSQNGFKAFGWYKTEASWDDVKEIRMDEFHLTKLITVIFTEDYCRRNGRASWNNGLVIAPGQMKAKADQIYQTLRDANAAFDNSRS